MCTVLQYITVYASAKGLYLSAVAATEGIIA